MSIPSFNTPSECLIYALTRVDECKETWEAYTDAASNAYSKAYNDQLGVLKGVRETLEKIQKASEAIMEFALSVLTVGVGGLIAGAAVKKLVSKELAQEAETWAKEKIKEPVKALTGLATKHFMAPSFEEAFKPAGITPDQYGNQLKEGIHLRTKALLTMLKTFQEQGSAGMNLKNARDLTERIVALDFVKNPPSREVEDSDFKANFQRKASLALWLTWAWVRDRAYWSNDFRRYGSTNFGELNAFAPIHQALLQCGVPAKEISQEGYTFGLPQRYTVIDMYGFIRWSFSRDAEVALFNGLPKHPQGIKYAETELKVKMSLLRTFGPVYAPFHF